jgi:hypothetical protein
MEPLEMILEPKKRRVHDGAPRSHAHEGAAGTRGGARHTAPRGGEEFGLRGRAGCFQGKLVRTSVGEESLASTTFLNVRSSRMRVLTKWLAEDTAQLQGTPSWHEESPRTL